MSGFKLKNLMMLLLAIAALVWPAIYNAQPFFFADTIAYIRGADIGMQKALGLTSAWVVARVAVNSSSVSAADNTQSTQSNPIEDKPVLEGRSIYYGALLYLGVRTGGFWFNVILQALVLILSIAMIMRALNMSIGPHLLYCSLIVGVLTTASFYASFLMPDVFAAVAILACAALLAGSLQTKDYFIWFCLLVSALAFHSTHWMICGGLLFVWVIYRLIDRKWSCWRGFAVIACALMVTVIANMAFSFAVKRAFGEPPIRPPFLMARLIEDGPGYRYLLNTCPENGFKVCEFLNRLPMAADDFLWGMAPIEGVFLQSPPEVQRALSSEQLKFIFAVLKYDTLGQTRASMKNMMRQLCSMGLYEFKYKDSEKKMFAAELPERYRNAFTSSRAYRGQAPIEFMGMVVRVVFLIGSALVIAFLAIRKFRKTIPREAIEVVICVIIGILLNAFITGALSGPHDRYGARVAWLMPLLAIVLSQWCFRNQVLFYRPDRRAGEG
jgi:hypothetical protein